MRTIERLLIQYGESHQNNVNVAIHTIAVPAIYFVTLGLLWSIPVPEIIAMFKITFAHIIAIPILIYYFKLSGPIGTAMTLLTIVCFGLINIFEAYGIGVWQLCLAVFTISWLLQFIGHSVEGKKPSFVTDLRFLLVGPAWWWVHWLKRMNISY